jgi:hypothetical protein
MRVPFIERIKELIYFNITERDSRKLKHSGVNECLIPEALN